MQESQAVQGSLQAETPVPAVLDEVGVEAPNQVINWGRIFAAGSLCLSVGSCVGFYLHGDHRKALYWLGATIINSTFVF